MVTAAHIRMPENGVFSCRVPPSLAVQPGDRCIAEVEYGQDIGAVLDIYGAGEDGANGEKAPSYYVVRKATHEDEALTQEQATLAEKARKSFALSTEREKGHVKILHARFSFDGARLFIRYSAQVPVDLRRFTRQLQRDFKTHVDLWQVGIRDEAALVGCLGICGRAACCCTWQCQSRSVNVRMAKTQEMSSSPAALNGTCGRLKCCLRFEYEQYREAGERLPESGSLVRCRDHEDAEGVVVGRDIMRGRLTVRMDDGRRLAMDAASVAVVRAAMYTEDKRGRGDAHEDSSDEWA